MNAAAQISAGRGVFLLGVFLAIAPALSYFAQLELGWIFMPWHIPILTTLGVGLMLMGLLRRFGIVRALVFGLFVVVCGGMWFTMLVASKTPEYAGPAKAGNAFPAFSAQRADGQPLTQLDLARGDAHVIVFYRGHW